MDNSLQSNYQQPSYFESRSAYDWVWALLVISGVGYVFANYHVLMDAYEIGILAISAPLLIWLGWRWATLQFFSLSVAALSILAISSYGGDLSRGESAFLLKYLFASQSAIMWMSALYVMATATYFGLLFSGREFVGKVASSLTR